MARERRSTPMPEAIPEPDPNEVSNRFDVTDLKEERAAALAPKKVHARKRRPSSEPITSEHTNEASGSIHLKDLNPSSGMITSEKRSAVSGEIRSKVEDIEDLSDLAELDEAKPETAANDNNSDDEPYAEMTITQEKPKAVPPPLRKRRPSSEPITSAMKKKASGEIDLEGSRSSADLITSSKSTKVSGEIRSKDEVVEDLTDLAELDETTTESSTKDDEPYEEITITQEEPQAAPVAPRRKRAQRVEMSAQALADKLAADTAKEKEQRLAEMSARVDKAIEDEDAKETEEKEESWFKQGEDESYVKKLAEKQQMEDTQKAADVRRHIAETYDRKESETILATSDEVEATAKQAEAMLASGELRSEVFNVKDYRYLLIEKARVERELETAGWWQARKLRAELRETDKSLADYEQQITSVHSGQAGGRSMARHAHLAAWNRHLEKIWFLRPSVRTLRRKQKLPR